MRTRRANIRCLQTFVNIPAIPAHPSHRLLTLENTPSLYITSQRNIPVLVPFFRYRNTPENILPLLDELKALLIKENIPVTIEAAAEYFLDEQSVELLEQDKELLSFGDKYVLFETNFISEPMFLKEYIFMLTTKGYKPVLAHPERYLYLFKNFDTIKDLINRGVYMQVNISSITGYYSKQAQQMAFELIDRQWVHFLGSDCHHAQHIEVMDKAMQHKYYLKALNLNLLNNAL